MRWLLGFALITSACAGSPAAPTPSVTPPAYVIIGDSVAWSGIDLYGRVFGLQWPIVERAVPGTWTNDAAGSTDLRSSWQPGGEAFEKMRAAVHGSPTAFLAHLGANDTVLDPPPTEASVYADLVRLVNGLQAAYPGSLLYLADVGQVWTYGDKRTENAAVRAAITRAWVELPTVRRGPQMADLTPDDGVHFLSAENVQIVAQRWIAVLAR